MPRNRSARWTLISFSLALVSVFATSCRCPAPSGGGGGEPTIVYASISVRCGGDVYTVSTGNTASTADCETTEGPSGTGAVCTDKKGNGASMSCVGGVGKCLESSGAGSCSIKAD